MYNLATLVKTTTCTSYAQGNYIH